MSPGRLQPQGRIHALKGEGETGRRPVSVPSLYWVAPERVACAERIQVVGGESSAEMEFFMAPDADGRLYLTVVSDHSDRKLESVSVSKAKQICPKIIGPEFWALDDVRDHWNELRLVCPMPGCRKKRCTRARRWATCWTGKTFWTWRAPTPPWPDR